MYLDPLAIVLTSGIIIYPNLYILVTVGAGNLSYSNILSQFKRPTCVFYIATTFS